MQAAADSLIRLNIISTYRVYCSLLGILTAFANCSFWKPLTSPLIVLAIYFMLTDDNLIILSRLHHLLQKMSQHGINLLINKYIGNTCIYFFRVSNSATPHITFLV